MSTASEELVDHAAKAAAAAEIATQIEKAEKLNSQMGDPLGLNKELEEQRHKLDATMQHEAREALKVAAAHPGAALMEEAKINDPVKFSAALAEAAAGHPTKGDEARLSSEIDQNKIEVAARSIGKENGIPEVVTEAAIKTAEAGAKAVHTAAKNFVPKELPVPERPTGLVEHTVKTHIPHIPDSEKLYTPKEVATTDGGISGKDTGAKEVVADLEAVMALFKKSVGEQAVVNVDPSTRAAVENNGKEVVNKAVAEGTELADLAKKHLPPELAQTFAKNEGDVTAAISGGAKQRTGGTEVGA